MEVEIGELGSGIGWKLHGGASPFSRPSLFLGLTRCAGQEPDMLFAVFCMLCGESCGCFGLWPVKDIVVETLPAKDGLRLGDELCTIAVDRQVIVHRLQVLKEVCTTVLAQRTRQRAAAVPRAAGWGRDGGWPSQPASHASLGRWGRSLATRPARSRITPVRAGGKRQPEAGHGGRGGAEWGKSRSAANARTGQKVSMSCGVAPRPFLIDRSRTGSEAKAG